MSCRKRTYVSPVEAHRAMRRISDQNDRRKGRRSERRARDPERAYRCFECGGWHITRMKEEA